MMEGNKWGKRECSGNNVAESFLPTADEDNASESGAFWLLGDSFPKLA